MFFKGHLPAPGTQDHSDLMTSVPLLLSPLLELFEDTETTRGQEDLPCLDYHLKHAGLCLLGEPGLGGLREMS